MIDQMIRLFRLAWPAFLSASFLLGGCISCKTSMESQAMTFSNPVWPNNFPDPFVLEHEGVFFAYATHQSAEGFQMMTSTDLVTWKHEGGVGLPEWSKDHLWAPEVHPWKGEFYLFYSALDPVSKKRDLAVAKGPSPRGPFKLVSKLIIGASVNKGGSEDGAIDPTLYVENGKPYLLYILEAQPRTISLVELAPDLSRTVGAETVLIRPDREIEKGILDAPTLIKRGDTYWLLFSTGWFQSWKKDACYQVFAASSKNLLGPYIKQQEPVLTSKAGETLSPGHQCVFQLKSGEWWIGYHAWNSEGEPMYGHNKAGRSFRIDRLEWTEKGPKALGPTITPQPKPRLK